MLVLLLGGMGSEAWTQTTYKVTYHVITLPFGGTGSFLYESTNHNVYRIEAIKKTVNQSADDPIKLPSEIKSPLMTDAAYTYYMNVTRSGPTAIFPDNEYSTFYTYNNIGSSNGTEVTGKVSSLGSVGDYDIYVTYTWDDTMEDGKYKYKTQYGRELALDGSKEYNIEFKESNGNTWFYALNMDEGRGNRAQAIPLNAIDHPSTDLVSKDIVTLNQSIGGSKDVIRKLFFFRWKFVNNDPYNFIIQTTYSKEFKYTEDGYWKINEGAQFFGSLENASKVRGNWLTNEVNKAYTSKDKNSITTKDKHGWFRGRSGEGRAAWTNGVQDHLYFSFTLLAHPTASYTLAASWVKVGGDGYDWVPNSSGQYLLMHHDPSTPPYAGPTFKTLEAAEQIRIHEIREYTYKVKTPFSKTVSEKFEMSDYEGHEAILDHVPESMKRKYTVLTGAYADEGLTEENARTTFEDVYDKDEREVHKNRDIWLKYAVSPSIPFEAASSLSATDMKSYNIFANKEDKHVVWYDTSGSPASNKFHSNDPSAPDGHSIYPHESHFSFIGDPYELYVVSKGAEEVPTAPNPNHYMALDATTATDNLIAAAEGDNSRWEIVWDNNAGGNANSFTLRKFNSLVREYNVITSTPYYVGWTTSGNYPLKGTGTVAESVRLRVEKLPAMEYTYYIVDNNNRIAVMATEMQPIGTTLGYETIPEIIRSPFLKNGTFSFYTYNTSDLATVGVDMTVDFNSGFSSITATNNDEDNKYKNHIFVKYTTLTDERVPLLDDNGDTHPFNVLLNSEYIYYDDLTNTIKSVSDLNSIPTGKENYYKWVLGGNDPYSMTIRNLGANKYVMVSSWANNAALSWVDRNSSDPYIPSTASRFIIKQSGTTENYYEVMATTRVVKDALNKIDVVNSVDASKTYYNIGRPNTTTVQMYSNSTYETGNAEILFELKSIGAHRVTYHLIDKFNQELLTVETRQAEHDTPQLPSQYVSPLVKKYYYYKLSAFVVSGDIYKLNDLTHTVTHIGDGGDSDDTKDIYVLYDANDIIDLNHTTMYLLKFAQGTPFRQEDGSDGMLNDADLADPNKSTPVYPYCNGDCNFNVYSKYQYDVQQEGAASTRTRWAWYVQSSLHDPYHVKILSRQTETYNGLERSAYFITREYEWGGEKHVVNTLDWPNISGVLATDYMVLGSVGQYRLVTSYPIAVDYNKDGDTNDSGENDRYVVDSFEQYWKTYDTAKKKLLNDLLPFCEERERTDRPDGSIVVPTTPASLREKLENTYGFHSYTKMAKAKRWNGYNAAGEKSKGWEQIEHWFQTVQMGSGYFDFIPTTIDPALILLDQHGWEIMRKPMPYTSEGEEAEKKLRVLASYDSPMVKEYIFWSSAKKRSGFHQYYLMDKRVGGSNYTATSLADLAPDGSDNVRDSKGNLNDQYVTYIVREEYALSYNPASKTAEPFLIRQGDEIANNDGSSTVAGIDVSEGGASKYIIDHIYAPLNGELWFVKPCTEIDTEMGYTASNHNWSVDAPNAYEDAAYSTLQTATLIEGGSSDPTVAKFGHFSFSNGFDPYNIQISSYKDVNKYFTLAMTGSQVDEGAIHGDYSSSGGSLNVVLANKNAPTVSGDSYDNSHFMMTNQTFMAVQDADGNMQLMPRFDHTRRMRDFRTLVIPTPEAADPDKLKETYTELYRPYVYNYRIIDNEGHESLRYQSGGELRPQTPGHFKSPLAKDFKYYKGLTEKAAGVYILTNIESKEFTASMAGAGMSGAGLDGNPIYVRYAYDEEADPLSILQGKWLTMQLNDKDAQYNEGAIKTGTKPATSPTDDLKDSKTWHWKFLKSPYIAPDPYAVKVFNRSQKDLPMSDAIATLEGIVMAQPDGATDYYQRFALLRHGTEDYALAVAGIGSHENYYFMNGAGLATVTPTYATIAKEGGFTSSSGTLTNEVKLVLTDDIHNTFTYKVYTHDDPVTPVHGGKYGTEAISAEQSEYEAQENGYAPVLPEEARSPLLNIGDFVYYEAEGDMGDAAKQLTNLYGLYEGDVYVRYSYNPDKSEYKVPNEIDLSGENVARGAKSNDSPLRLDGKLPYNVFWYRKNIMKSNGTAVGTESATDLKSESEYEWYFEGNDPYAIKIKNKRVGTFIYASQSTSCTVCSGTGKTNCSTCSGTGIEGEEKCTNCDGTGKTNCSNCDGLGVMGKTCELSSTPTTFMLLKRDDGFEYGRLAVTGHKNRRLSENDNVLTLTGSEPTKFIIFALGTLKVVYHLVIANIGDKVDIPHRTYVAYDSGNSSNWNSIDGSYSIDWDSSKDVESIRGTTNRVLDVINYQLGDDGGVSYPDLEGTKSTTYYCKDVGRISLGDELTVPQEFYRPNVYYTFYVHGIEGGTSEENSSLNTKYKGLELKSKAMGTDQDLIGKTIYINIRYSFADLETNSGSDFVLDVNENKWYTVETMRNGKPWLAQYTNAWGFELKEGRGSHYTNDYLWTPIGDPYGFKLYNRYMEVNSGEANTGEPGKKILTLGSTFSEGQEIKMKRESEADYTEVNTVYELLADEGTAPGYFIFHPVANYTGTQYGFKAVAEEGGKVAIKLGAGTTEFTFGLSAELMKPYFDRAGYVGGLKKSVYDAPVNKALVTAMKSDSPQLTFEQLMAAQNLVYDFDDNIVPFETGYYRLHSTPDLAEIDPVRYASGYTHKTELDKYEGHNISMHFYEKNSEEVRQFTDLKEGFTYSPATRGDIVILPVERDPASIFYFEKKGTGRTNTTTISTQGLYVKGVCGQGVAETTDFEGNASRAAAVMSNSAGQELFVMDIGGGILLIHDNKTDGGRANLKYFSFDHSNDLDGKPTIYDLKMTHNTHTDHAKWCMQPVQQSATKGVNELPLKLNLNKGGDGYYYATFCAPFDVLLTDAANDAAFICKVWDTEILHLKKVGKYNTEANGCPAAYKGSNQFVPAGTPVIIRSTKTSVTMALPSKEPSTTLANHFKSTNIFSGVYLEQLLEEEKKEVSNDVYTFGLPLKGTVTKHADYALGGSDNNGRLTISLPQSEETGIGFYTNANYNRETAADMGSWIPNNRYVYANKIFYRSGVDPGASARRQTRSPDFIPVVFDDDDEEEDDPIGESLLQRPHDNRVYDLLGRCVASGEEVVNGTWRRKVASGIYILNGRKIYVK